MLRMRPIAQAVVAACFTLLIGAVPTFAQNNGKVTIHVSPKQAYVFVDGKAVRDGSQTMTLSAGQHTIGVYNYGYAPQTQDVNITQGGAKELNVSLQPSGDKVSGPFGDIQLEGHPRAAVLLNGTTPAYFVGSVDEFDNNWIWHQRLLVKPGTYQVTVTERGKTVWSGPVAVKAGERSIVYLNRNGEIKTKDFKDGLTLGPQPRFDAGIASAMVPVAPVTAQLSASQSQTTCGQPAMLNWKATDVADTSITNLGNVPASGDRMVSPTQTTTYQLVAKGPGGEVEQTATINVNAQPTATLTLSRPEVRYHRVGDKVVEQDSATLNWTTSNAGSVTVQPLGSVTASGSRNIEAMPSRTTPGPINQDVTYTLNVTNPCGGAVTRTATLHIAGSIDPAPAPAPPSLTLASLFYPTNYPLRRNPSVGLVLSQQKMLLDLATHFKKHLQYDNSAKLLIIGYADERGDMKYNLALSQRRADRAKEYLLSHGIAADRIETRAEGENHQLTEEQVQKLQSQDTEKPPKWMQNRKKATWLAYNRRVDVNLEPAGQKSVIDYPDDVPAARILWQRAQPSLKAVEAASQTHGTEQAQAQ